MSFRNSEGAPDGEPFAFIFMWFFIKIKKLFLLTFLGFSFLLNFSFAQEETNDKKSDEIPSSYGHLDVTCGDTPEEKCVAELKLVKEENTPRLLDQESMSFFNYSALAKEFSEDLINIELARQSGNREKIEEKLIIARGHYEKIIAPRSFFVKQHKYLKDRSILDIIYTLGLLGIIISPTINLETGDIKFIERTETLLYSLKLVSTVVVVFPFGALPSFEKFEARTPFSFLVMRKFIKELKKIPMNIKDLNLNKNALDEIESYIAYRQWPEKTEPQKELLEEPSDLTEECIAENLK